MILSMIAIKQDYDCVRRFLQVLFLFDDYAYKHANRTMLAQIFVTMLAN